MLTAPANNLNAFVVTVDMAEAGWPTDDGFQNVTAKALQIARVQLAKRRSCEIDQIVVRDLIANIGKT